MHVWTTEEVEIEKKKRRWKRVIVSSIALVSSRKFFHKNCVDFIYFICWGLSRCRGWRSECDSIFIGNGVFDNSRQSYDRFLKIYGQDSHSSWCEPLRWLGFRFELANKQSKKEYSAKQSFPHAVRFSHHVRWLSTVAKHRFYIDRSHAMTNQRTIYFCHAINTRRLCASIVSNENHSLVKWIISSRPQATSTCEASILTFLICCIWHRLRF